MTEAEANAFKVAAVIYTMVNFLAVHGGSRRIPIEIFGSLVNPSRIKNVNWCGHVRRRLLEEAVKLQEQLKRGDKVIEPGGCSLYAQVHYLDNLSLEELELNEREFPRALIFTDILLDCIRSPIDGAREFGKSMFKRETDVCYSSCSLPSGYEIVEVRISETGIKRKRDETNYFEENGRKKRSTTILTLEGSIRMCNIKILPKDHVNSSFCSSPLAKQSDEGSTCTEGDGNIVVCPIEDGASMEPVSPFEIPFDHRDKPFHKWFAFFDRLKDGKVSRLQWDWFIHSEPWKIEIAGWALRADLIPGGYFTITVMDAILRAYLGRDNAMYLLKPKKMASFHSCQLDGCCIAQILWNKLG